MNKFVFILILLCAYSASAQITLNIDIKTGDDNLERKKYQKNPEIIIKLRDGREIRKANINRGQTWENNSLRRVALELPENAGLGDITEFILERQRDYGTGGYRFDTWEKDDWVVKAITISAVVRESGRASNVSVANLNPRGNVYRFTFNATSAPGDGWVFKTPISYQAATPAVPSTSRNATITATFGTGGDDLRGRGDNVKIRLKTFGSSQPYTIENINGGLRWENNSEFTITKEVPNSSRLDIDTISTLVVHHTGGASNDEWELNKLRVVIKKPASSSGSGGRETSKLLVDRTSSVPIHRFDRIDRQKAFPILSASRQDPLRNITITAEISTGDDDLRGGSDNLDIIFHLRRSNRVITLFNVNRGSNWPNNSTRRLTNMDLASSHDLSLNDIKSVELRHTGGGGIAADNWKLAGFKVTATKDGESRVLVDRVSRLVYFFTGDSRTKIFPIE